MNKNTIVKTILFALILSVSFSVLNNATAKRMQFIKQKHFCYTKGNTTSTINLNYFSDTKFTGDITVATEGNDDAITVGVDGTAQKNVLTKTFNDTAPTFTKGYKNSRQDWKIIKLKNGDEALLVKYYSIAKPTKYITYTYKVCK
jgi:hypothetical protein